MRWYNFDPAKGSYQKRPPIKKYVLVRLEMPREANGFKSHPDAIVLGYRKDGGGDKQSPYFVTPGVLGKAYAWCDCLPEGFERPMDRDLRDYAVSE